MVAGKLNEIIKFVEPVTVKNNYGATKTEWEDRITTRASVVQNRGTRGVINNEIFNSYTIEFEVWDYHLINESWRVIWNKKIYQIESIVPERTQKKQTIVTSLVNE